MAAAEFAEGQGKIWRTFIKGIALLPTTRESGQRERRKSHDPEKGHTVGGN